jgi:hypothetical protein
MRHFNSKRLVALLATIVLVISAGPLRAQSFYGSILGTVTDQSGAIVPGAQVTATNIGTNEKREIATDAAGTYSIVNLVPANYKLEVEKGGFKRFTRQPVTVQVGGQVRIDVAMQVGSATETVQVTSMTPLLQTESGAEIEAVEGERVQEMPLNGRNTMNLLALDPGVVSGVPSGASALNMGTHTQAGAWADYSVSGGFTGATAMYLDGASLNLLQQNPIAFIPTQDATQEFDVMSSGISPEFGRFGGGVVNITTKSGTNQWHGSVYEYFRNKVLNANSFFSNRNGVPRGNWNQDQYGVTLGNPIVKNKIFSFFSWEGFRLLVGVPGATNVPTDNMRAGKIYSNSPVKDPFNRPGCVTAGSDSGGTYYQISPSCFDPTANAIVNTIKYWPEPLQPNNKNSNFNNVPDTGNNANQYTERVDFNLSDRQRLFARYTYWGQVDLPYNELENFTENSFSHNRSTQAVLGDTYTLNPTSIVDVRLAFLRQFSDNQPGTLNKDLTPLGGAWPTLQNQMDPKYFPGPHVLGTGLYPFFGMNVDSYDYLNSYDLGFSLSKIKGNHSLKFGGEIRLSDSNAPGFTLDGGGFFAFVGLPWLSGNNFADFLFGTPASGAIQKVSPSSSFNWYQGYYAADTWQVNRKLTLNYGLRWELPGSIGERNNKDTVLLPNTKDPATGAPGTMALVDSSLYSSKYVTDVRHDLFAPRLGFAYRITNATVVRGGYGITYLPPDMAAGVMSNTSPVNTMTTSWNNLPFGSTALGPGTFSVLSNPFPTTGILPPVGRTNPAGWTAQLAGQAISGPVPHQPYAYTQQWNLNLGHQFPGDVMVEVAYNGSSSNNLPAVVDLNELPRSDWTAALATQANQPYGTYYTDVQDSAAMVGVANYNSGLVKVEKRFKSGGVISGNYTYSRSLADAESSAAGGFGNGAQAVPNTGNFIGYGPQDSEHLRTAEYSLSSFDIPQRLMVSYVLNLPFGDGQKWAHVSGAAGAMVSGWAVNGITDYQKGFPMSMNQATSNITLDSFGYGSTVSGGDIRPNTVAGCNPVIGGSGKNRIDEWFKTSCYTVAPDLTLGDEPRVDPRVRTDGIANWDLSLLKSTKIHENVNVQFRAEFFNTFNHPQFAAPQNAADDPVNFGVVIAQMNTPRLVQFSLRLNF